MPRYYVAGIPFDSNDALQHYGVKGMKWNQHIFGIDANDKYIKWLKDTGQNIGKFTNNAATTIGNAAAGASREVGKALNKASNFVTGNQARKNADNASINAIKKQIVANNSNPASRASQNLRGAANVERQMANVLRTSANDTPFYRFITKQNLTNEAIDKEKNAQNLQRQADDAAKLSNQVKREQKQDARDAYNQVMDAERAYDRTLPGMVNKGAEAVGNAAEKAVGGAKGFINSAGKWVSNTIRDAGNAADEAYRNSGMKGFVDDVQNRLTGNADRNTAEMLRRTADEQENPNSPVHATGEQYNPELLRAVAADYDKKADNALFNRVGQAVNDAGKWAGQVSSDVAKAANDVGDTVGNAANGAREWLGNMFNGAKEWAGNAAKDVGNVATDAWNGVTDAANQAGQWIGDRANDVSSFVDDKITGDMWKRESEKFRDQAEESERNGYGANPEASRKAADVYQQRADNSLFGRIGNAANAVGNWVGNAANDAKDWAGNAVNDVGNAANQAGQWLGDRAKDAGNAAGSAVNAVGNAANDAGQWIGDRARDVGNVATDAWNGVTDAANQAGQWIGDRAQDAGNLLSEMANPHYQLDAERLTENYRDYLNEHPENPQSPKHEEWLKEQIKNDPQLREYYERMMKHSDISDKPEGVGDAFWQNYIAHGGTREDYERDWR